MAQNNPYPGDSLQRLQAVELDILRAIRDVCETHGITYFLDGGTTLGAVRHGGFIPWDDDADVAMPQEDYEHFLRVAPEALPEGYTLHTCYNTPNMPELWAKVERDGTRFVDELAHDAGHDQGIFVDVFCYRRLDEDDEEMQRQIRDASICQRMSFLNATGRPKIPKNTPALPVVKAAVKAVHATVARAWDAQKMSERLDRAWQSPCPGNRMANACYPNYCWQWRETLLPTSTIEFEGEQFQAPAMPERYLETLYGDWQTLPPEDARYPHRPLVLDFGDGVNVMEG